MFINNFDPVAIEVFSIEIRWYSLAYITGILISWYLAKKFFVNKNFKYKFDDYITYVIIGLILGGRLGYVLFYNPHYYAANPFDVLRIWDGGMSFHGGFLGVVIAVLLYSLLNRTPLWSVADLIAISSPPGLFFGRLANFINAELWGSPTNVPWGVVFPGERAQDCLGIVGLCARHPSQIYEALLEGLVLFIVLIFIVIYKLSAILFTTTLI